MGLGEHELAAKGSAVAASRLRSSNLLEVSESDGRGPVRPVTDYPSRRVIAKSWRAFARHDGPYMSIPPPGTACVWDSSFGNSAMDASVARKRAATDAEFCSARRVTLVGFKMPSSITSPYSPVAAL